MKSAVKVKSVHNIFQHWWAVPFVGCYVFIEEDHIKPLLAKSHQKQTLSYERKCVVVFDILSMRSALLFGMHVIPIARELALLASITTIIKMNPFPTPISHYCEWSCR